MRDRIARHRAERGDEFLTVEAPLDLAAAIRSSEGDAIVVDCLTLWLSNVSSNTMAPEFAALEEAARSSPSCVILLTNDVGCGIAIARGCSTNGWRRPRRKSTGWFSANLCE
jgi:adenosylcobinamide kinase/adenosylcobinamide-phosphate guanylyltransferase